MTNNSFLGIPSETSKKYQDDITLILKQEDNVQDIKKQIKEELSPNFKTIIGVFGSYNYIYPNEKTGDDVIDYTANKISKQNPDSLVITGKYHYIHFKNGNWEKE